MNIKINGVTISSPYGATEPFRNGIPHTGIDIPLNVGTPLHTVENGIVDRLLGGNCGEGVAIKTENGTEHIFCHMNKVQVGVGERVETGDIIGISGNTGNTTGPHLHFAVKENGEFIDPSNFADSLVMPNSGIYINPLPKGGISEWFKNRGSVNNYEGAPKTSAVMDWLTGEFHDFLLNCWEWFVFYLPDIMGYSAVLTGICIIIGAMIGKGGMIKPFAVFAAAMILALCILGGA
jgi:hypothetical protein